MSGYAVDMHGVLVDGVVVEKEKARVTFEAETRNISKPSVSIAEHVVGNVFKTRIFPVPKNGTRTVKVTYVEELTTNNMRGVFDLPLVFPNSIDNYALSVTVDVVDGGVPTIDTDMVSNQPMGVQPDEKKRTKKEKQVG